MIENILEKLTFRELGMHLSNYSNLYLNPVDAWKKASSANNAAYNFVVLHIVYFTVLILIDVRDTYSALQICVLEILITFIPLLIYVVPYKISSLLFHLEFDWKRLFRLLLVLKFQFIPLYYIGLKFSKYSESEDLYIILDNSIWIVWIAFTVVFPILTTLNIWKKISFIALNYLSFVVIMLCFVTLFANTDMLNVLGDDLGKISPSREYGTNSEKFSKFMTHRIDKYFMLIGFEKDPGLITYYTTQFVNVELANCYLSKIINESVDMRIKLDSALCAEDKSRTSKKDSLKLLYKKEQITGRILDSFKKVITADFNKDLLLTDSLSKHANFKSNRAFYKKQKLYLQTYRKSYADPELIGKIQSSALEKNIIKLEGARYLTLLKIDSTFYNPARLDFEIAKEKLQDRDDKSSILPYIWFYPIDKILGFCGYYD
ncbi:hypothetical protein Flavo103_09770 [Flavobacterium collinsii]|uniref:hypothetical protein n=1 Tax=Flavobacterium collinsii TaxID=1114861 RepID=UPI0022BC1A20|nr:hypothetical protein [Flavobacterium collinsii]GIQ57841.1 hypothetical protein Flavo103_09770 [Flavobacterium collinsii]